MRGRLDQVKYKEKATAQGGGGSGPPPPPEMDEYLHPALGLPANYGGTEYFDGPPYTMGTWFTVLKAGSIVAVRFWKTEADNTSTHVVAIYKDTFTTAVATETTSGEPPGPCWIEVPLSSPVVVATDAASPTDYTHVYCTAVYRLTGQYPATTGAIVNGAFTATSKMYLLSSGEMHAVDSAIAGNGVFNVAGFPNYPTDSFNQAYYWVDVKWHGLV